MARYGVITVASSDEHAQAVDEIHRGLSVGPLPADQEAAAIPATSQVGGILPSVRRTAAQLVADPYWAREFRARHELDIPIGMLPRVPRGGRAVGIRQNLCIAGYLARIDDPDMRRPRCPKTRGRYSPEAGRYPWTSHVHPMTTRIPTTSQN